ncbi:hypothetical protein [Nocardia sp. NPDC047038]|uniref:hypothetical protein n=1 Tax=Nocardia sp. NPDC047038 TaxID=3154338 RepID=UPI0033EE2A90
MASALPFVLGIPATANAQPCSWCPPPAATQFGSDNFDDGSIGSDWIVRGGGNLYVSNGEISGVGTPSVPLSFAYFATPAPGDTQESEAVVRWSGRDPEHSSAGVVVRANQALVGNGSTIAPAGASGVHFAFTRGVMALYYEDPAATNGVRPVTGNQAYVSTWKFAEGSRIKVRAEGTTYSAYVNGSLVLQGTVPADVIPPLQHDVGIMIQDDSAVTAPIPGGQPPANLDDWVGRYAA